MDLCRYSSTEAINQIFRKKQNRNYCRGKLRHSWSYLGKSTGNQLLARNIIDWFNDNNAAMGITPRKLTSLISLMQKLSQNFCYASLRTNKVGLLGFVSYERTLNEKEKVYFIDFLNLVLVLTIYLSIKTESDDQSDYTISYHYLNERNSDSKCP